MHSTETTTQGGKISRPVSPKTIPPPRGRSTDGSSSSSTNKEAQPKMHPPLSTTTNVPPPPSTKPNSPSPHHRRTASSSSSSAYILALQTLDPRPLQDLHNERSYLLHDLQKQGDRATRLFHRYAAVEARLAAATAGATAGTRSSTAADTKRCRREAALVRAKIAESTQQEQLILLRLGEIHVELQNRERWMLVHHHHNHHHRQPLFQPPVVFPPSPAPLPLPSLPALAVVQPAVSSNSSSLGEVCSPLGLCREQQQQQQRRQQRQGGGERDTPVTDQSSSGYFSSCASPASAAASAPAPRSSLSSSVLSPLSPCFTPGVVFAEDIWSRAAAASKTPEAEREGDGERGGDEEGESTPTESVDGTDEVGQGGEVPVCQGRLEREGGGVESNSEGDVEDVMVVVVPRGDNAATPDTNRSFSSSGGDGFDSVDNDVDGDPEEDTQAWRAKLRRVSLYFPLSGRAKEKRMSLPYLKGMWSRSRRASLQSTVG